MQTIQEIVRAGSTRNADSEAALVAALEAREVQVLADAAEDRG